MILSVTDNSDFLKAHGKAYFRPANELANSEQRGEMRFAQVRHKVQRRRLSKL